MRLEELDCQQRRVVESMTSPHRKILVLGGAGTGKTTTALWSARRYFESGSKNNSSRVLFLTFSRTAVNQIVRRSPGMLADFHNRIEVMTFHGLSHWLIRAFGRYAGYGRDTLELQSSARTKLYGPDVSRITYDDLMPRAANILNHSKRIRDMISSRWAIVICDEAQDTSLEQWRLVRLLGVNRILMLGDFNQMIYSSFVPGVSKLQFQKIRDVVDLEVHLQHRSYRDPSGAIPAVAESILQREFLSDAVKEAIGANRFRIYFDTRDEDRFGIIEKEIKNARLEGMRDVGVFSGSNNAVGEMAEMLNTNGIDHALIGIPEAHAEALRSMATECGYAIGLFSESQVRESFAVFATACVRSRNVPKMAQALIGLRTLPEPIQKSIVENERALRSTPSSTLRDVAEVAMRSWHDLGFAFGSKPWQRASRHFARMIYSIRDNPCNEETIKLLIRLTDRTFAESLVDLEIAEIERVKLMTFHQTKGRETDLAIHVFNQRDFFGNGAEPFEEASRLLYVAISRARRRVVVILPTNPHPLLEPYEALNEIQRDIRTETG